MIFPDEDNSGLVAMMTMIMPLLLLMLIVVVVMVKVQVVKVMQSKNLFHSDDKYQHHHYSQIVRASILEKCSFVLFLRRRRMEGKEKKMK